MKKLIACMFLSLLAWGMTWAQDRGLVQGGGAAASSNKRIALVIGNSEYVHAGALKNPVNDADLMEVALKQVGFEVMKVKNASLKEMKDVLYQFHESINRGNYGVALYYYSGHGMEVDGKNYLMPVDAYPRTRADVPSECLVADRVLANMEEAGAKTKIVVLDACRNNPLARSWDRNGGFTGLGHMDAPDGTLIAYSTKPGTVALDGTGKNSPYTEALARYLVEPGISILDLFLKVGKETQLATERLGGKQVPFTNNSLTENFYFSPNKTATNAPSVSTPTYVPPTAAVRTPCSAMVSATERKEFMCHNLGAANTSADPFTPSWEINGGYWQWGRKEMAAAGPSGPGSGQAKEGEISGWSTNKAPDGAWKEEVKTVNDPCPSGYRVPTEAEWDAVLKYNSVRNVGTWEGSATNYSSGKKIGDQLFLPAAGYRDNASGALYYRGYYGNYWSSTENESTLALGLYFNSGYANTYDNGRINGRSVRCIAE